MFEFFRKKRKSDLEMLIEKDGLDNVAVKYSRIILQKLVTQEIAYQFVLEEVEAASKGNDKAIRFARTCGVSPQNYEGSLKNSRPEVDGPDGPQQLVLFLCMELQPNIDLVVDFRIKILENIMQHFSIGKYASQRDSDLAGGMRLEEENIDILFIVHDNVVIYTNDEVDHLFQSSEKGSEKLDGKVVNFVFSGRLGKSNTEVFVALNADDAYKFFTLQHRTMNWLEFVASVIFKCERMRNIFSRIDVFNTQYIYVFNLYRKNGQYFMVNHSQTEAYIIDAKAVLRNDVDELKSIFWGLRSLSN